MKTETATTSPARRLVAAAGRGRLRRSDPLLSASLSPLEQGGAISRTGGRGGRRGGGRSRRAEQGRGSPLWPVRPLQGRRRGSIWRPRAQGERGSQRPAYEWRG
jgi:hypothetical protein